MNIEKDLRELMSQIFEVKESEICDESSPHSIEKWDSLNHLKLALAIEKKFNFKFDNEDIPTLVSLKIISATISSYVE